MDEETVEGLLEEYAMMVSGLQPLIQAQETALAIAKAPLDNIKAKIVELVLAQEHSTDTIYGRATYRKPSIRTSWDNKALNGYAAAHPEIEQFRKEANVKASVVVKLV